MNPEKVSCLGQDDSVYLHVPAESDFSERNLSLLEVTARHDSRCVQGPDTPNSSLPIDQHETLGLEMPPSTPRQSVGSQKLRDLECEGRSTLSFHPENLSNYLEVSESDISALPSHLSPSFVPLNPLIQQRLRLFVALLDTPEGLGHAFKPNYASKGSRRHRKIRKFVYKNRNEAQQIQLIASKSPKRILDTKCDNFPSDRRESAPVNDVGARSNGPPASRSLYSTLTYSLTNPNKPSNPSLAPTRLSLTSNISASEPYLIPLTFPRRPQDSRSPQVQSETVLRLSHLPPLTLDRLDFEWIFDSIPSL